MEKNQMKNQEFTNNRSKSRNKIIITRADEL